MNLSELKALASAATKGPWNPQPNNEWDEAANIEFIAAFNPATALTLIEALETAMRGLEGIELVAAGNTECWPVADRARATLSAVNEQLK